MGEDKQEIQDRKFFVDGEKKRGENRRNDRWEIIGWIIDRRKLFRKKKKREWGSKEKSNKKFFYRSWTTGISKLIIRSINENERILEEG